MYDRELLESVATATCDYTKLLKEYPNQTKIEYDTVRPFEKYYRLSSILLSIEKYQRGEITDGELAHWACIYDWIINGRWEVEEETVDKATFVIREEISDWLDSLSFYEAEFDESGEAKYDLETRKLIFGNLDFILQTISEWSFYYVRVDKTCEEETLIVAVNHVRELWAQFVVDYLSDETDMRLASLAHVRYDAVADGYAELRTYFMWDDDYFDEDDVM